MNKLELRSQLGRTRKKLLLEYFENEMRVPSSAQPLMANPFTRTVGKLLFTCCLTGVALEDLISGDTVKLGDKGLHVYRMLTHYFARDDSGLSLARRKDATCFWRCIISVIPDAAIQACYQKAAENRLLEKRASRVILNLYQRTGIEKNGDSRQFLENHAKIDEIRRILNKKIDSSRDVHLALFVAEECSKSTKRGGYQYVSGVMKMSYNSFLSTEAGAAYMNFRVTELLMFWTEKIIEIDTSENGKPSPDLLLEKGPEVICVPRSEKRVKLRLGGEGNVLFTNLGNV